MYTSVDLSIKWTDRNADAIRQWNRSLRGAVSYPHTSYRIKLQDQVAGSRNRIKQHDQGMASATSVNCKVIQGVFILIATSSHLERHPHHYAVTHVVSPGRSS